MRPSNICFAIGCVLCLGSIIAAAATGEMGWFGLFALGGLFCMFSKGTLT